MKTIDWTKANAWIDSYISHLTNKDELPGRFGRTWLEFEAEKVGMVQDGRGWMFGECHAVWYASLIRTKRLHYVNRIEKQILNRDCRNKPTTLGTVRKLLHGRLRDTAVASMLRNLL